MADRDGIYRWLQGASWRHTTPDMRKIIEGLISEGRAEWVNRWNRARAIPNPPAKKKRDYKSECAALRQALERIASVAEREDADTDDYIKAVDLAVDALRTSHQVSEEPSK